MNEFRRTILKNKIKRYKYLYFLMIPGILWFVVFHMWPLYGIVIAFQDYIPGRGFLGSPWVGLRNFRNLMDSIRFTRLLSNTILISFYKLFFGFPMPIILALMINSVKNKTYKKIIQTISYLPHFLSWVIVSGIIFALFNPYYGVLPAIFDSLAIKFIDISKDPRYFRSFLVITAIWKGMGWSSIIYLAALAGIDPQLYEAATIDGANRWKQLTSITLPSIMPIVAIVLILQVGAILREDFQQIYLLAGSDPRLILVSDVFETFIYRVGIREANFSFPAAVGVFQSFFGMLLVLGSNKIAKKLGYEGIW